MQQRKVQVLGEQRVHKAKRRKKVKRAKAIFERDESCLHFKETIHLKEKKSLVGAGEMTQPEEGPEAKTGGLSLIPGTHIVEENN